MSVKLQQEEIDEEISPALMEALNFDIYEDPEFRKIMGQIQSLEKNFGSASEEPEISYSAQEENDMDEDDQKPPSPLPLRSSSTSSPLPPSSTQDEDDDDECHGPFSPDTLIPEYFENAPYDKQYKVIILGESGVGKTNLLKKWLNKKKRNSVFPPTLNVELVIKAFRIDKGGGGNYQVVKVVLWDTAGQETYRAVTRSYYRGAQGAILVYDVTRMESFRRVGDWLDDLKGSSGDNIQVVMVGNKVDLEEDREVTREEGTALAQEFGLNFMETSALSGKNVEKAFQILLNDIHQMNSRNQLEKEEERQGPQGKETEIISLKRTEDESEWKCFC